MNRIFRTPSPAAALRILGVCAFLCGLLVPGSARAGTFDTLGQAEQDAVLDQLKTHLPTLLPENDNRTVTQALRTIAARDVRELSRLAGQAAGGEYAEAAAGVARIAGDELKQSVEAELDTFIQGVESPIAQGALQFLKDHPSLSRDVARDLLSGEWEKARDALWKTAAAEGSAWIRTTTEQTLINAYNWVFGAQTRTIAGTPISPAHLLIYTAKLETEILGKWKRQLPLEKMQAWFELYRRDGWAAFEDQAGISQQAFGDSGAYGELYGLGPEDLKDLFTSCSEAFVQTCLEARAERARAQQRQTERALKAAADAEKQVLADRLAAVQTEKERLARESSADFAAAMAEAKQIAARIETAAGAVAAHCETFSEADRRRERALAAVAEAEGAVAVVQRAIEAGRACREMEDHRAGLAGDLDVLRDRKSAFDRALTEAATASQETCTAADAVADARDKARGRTSVDAATRHASELAGAIQRGEALANRIRGGKEDLARAVTEIEKELEEARKLAGASAETDAAFAAIEAVAGAPEEFEAARKTMEGAAIKAQGLQQVIEEANPIDLNPIEYAAEWLAQTPNRVRNTRIFQILGPYRKAPEVRTLLETVEDQLAALRPASCVRRWESVQGDTWREPRIPEGLADRAADVRRECEALPDDSAFDDLLREAERIAADMEAEEVGLWIHQRDGESCVAEAVQAFDALPDAGAALAAAVTELESLCSEARAHEEAARDASEKIDSSVTRLAELLDGTTVPSSASEAFQACDRLEAVRDGVARSATTAKTQAAEARRSASAATSALTGCRGSQALATADAAERAARNAAREAVVAMQRAEEQDDGFDRIVAGSRPALDALRRIDDRLRQAEIVALTLRNHRDNLLRSREAAQEARRRCTERGREVLAQWEAAGGAGDASLTALGPRIRAATSNTETPPGPESADAVLRSLAQGNQEIREMIAALSRCSQASSPYDQVLAAQQAVLGLDAVLADLDGLDGLRDRCGYDPRADTTGGDSGDDDGGYFDPEEFDRAAADGRTPPREPTESGAIGPPIPPPPGESDDGFEKRPEDDRRRRPPRPVGSTPPDIVDQGTSAGDLPRDEDPGDPEDGDDRGQDPRPDPRPGDPEGRDGSEPGGVTDPGGGGTDDESPGDMPKPGDEPGGGEGSSPGDSGDGAESGGNGSGTSTDCEQASNDLIEFMRRFEAEFRAHAGDDEDDEDCQWFIDLDREMLRLVERYERACRRPVENKEIIQQQIDQLRTICGDGSGSSSDSGDEADDDLGLEPSPYFGGNDPCASCREAYYVNCMGLNDDDAFCSRNSSNCPRCPAGADLSCPTVRKHCIQDQMYIKHQNRPDWTLDELREKAEGICAPC